MTNKFGTLFAFSAIIQSYRVSCLNCKDVLTAGTGAMFDVEELSSVKYITQDDLQECFVYLGKDKLQPKQAETVWSAVLQVYGSVEEIPESRLQELGWIMLAIPPTHFYNMSFTEPDTISAFGKYRSLSKDQLQALRESILNQWSDKGMEELTGYDLAALGQILCSFNTSEVAAIHPDSYKEAASQLSTLQDCPMDVIKELANLAVSSMAFGDPSLWTSSHVAAVGCVMAGLPSIAVIPPEAIEGLTMDAVPCLSDQMLKGLSKEQLSMLPPTAAFSLTKEQKSLLSRKQMAGVTAAIEGHQSNNSACSLPKLLIESVLMFLIKWKWFY